LKFSRKCLEIAFQNGFYALDFFQLTPHLTFYPAREIESRRLLNDDAADFYTTYWYYVDEDVTKLLCNHIDDLDPAIPYFAEALLFRVYGCGFVARENGACVSSHLQIKSNC
jgi:hypothetical protein